MKKLLLPLLIGFLLAILFTLPAIFRLNSHFISDGADAYQFAGFQYLMADNLKQGKWPLADSNQWFYPNGIELSRSYDGALFSLGGAVLLLLTSQPILSYNLMIIITFVFNFLAIYLLLEYIKKNSFFNLLGATIFGFSFYALARGAGHSNLLMIGSFPLLILAILRLKKSADNRNFALLGLALVLSGLSSAQYLAITFIVGLFLLPICFIFYYQDTLTFFRNIFQNFKKTLLTAIVTLAILGPFMWPLFSAYLKQDYYGRDHRADFSPPVINLVIANPFISVLSSKLAINEERTIEYVVYLGLIELIILAIYLPKLLVKDKRIAFIFATLIVTLILTLGVKNPETGIILPYYFLYLHFPFNVVPETGRFIILAYIQLAILISLILQTKFKPLNEERRFIVAFIFALIILERISFGGYFQTKTPTKSLIDAVKNTPAAAIVEIPNSSTQEANVLPAFFHKATIFNQSHWLGHTQKTKEFLFQSGTSQLICKPELHLEKHQVEIGEQKSFTEILDNLVAIDATTIILHRDHKLDWPECASVLEIVSREFPRLMTAIPSQGENSEAHLRWSSTPLQSGLFFPKKGEVKIFGLEYAPAESGKLEITLDGQNFDLTKYREKVFPRPIEGFTLNLDALDKNSGSFEVQAGSILSVKSPLVPVEQGFLTIWYHYQVDPRSDEQATLKQGRLERVYFDETSEVYTIN